jgi:hypothetical protein
MTHQGRIVCGEESWTHPHLQAIVLACGCLRYIFIYTHAQVTIFITIIIIIYLLLLYYYYYYYYTQYIYIMPRVAKSLNINSLEKLV